MKLRSTQDFYFLPDSETSSGRRAGRGSSGDSRKQQQPENRPQDASRRPAAAAAVSFVRQQVAPWSQQKKNRKQVKELDDWLTFPAHAEVVGHGAAALTATRSCHEYDEPLGERLRSHPTGTGRRAERRYPAGSPARPTESQHVRTGSE